MNSLIFRKYIVALTGFFLCIFLIAHLSANFILLWPEETARRMYNAYSALLSGNILIQLVAYLLYLSIFGHIVYATLITFKNKKAKGKTYVINNSSQNSTWAARNMGLLGGFILIFIVIHLANFWARVKLGIGEAVPNDGYGNKDLYSIAAILFDNIYYVTFYSLLMIPLGFHLFHGIKSAFKSLGFYHKKGLGIIEKVSSIFALVMAFSFGVIPIIMYMK